MTEDAEENLQKKLEVIEREDKEIKAFIDVFEEEAKKRAKEINKKIKEGRGGKLAGLVLAIKNNIAIKGKRLTCSSKMLEKYISPYDATVIEKILSEDAIIIGTTNMDEFAAGSDTTHSAFFSTRNPVDKNRVPGGSSGGSAAAVAAGMCDLALASDTGGSIRCPAAFCGVLGFKPTYGAVSRYGLVDMAMSLDQIGVMGKDPKETKTLFDIIKGRDDKDPITHNFEERKSEIKRVGIPLEFFYGVNEKIIAEIDKVVKKLEKEVEIMGVSLPSTKYVVPVYYLQMAAEFSSAMQKYDGLRYGAPSERSEELYTSFEKVRRENLGREVKRRILLGTYITTKEYREAWYTQTLRARELIKSEFKRVFEEVDVIIGPVMPCFPWKFGEKIDPIEMYSADILTVSANLAGIPAGVVPIGEVDGLPAAIQVHGREFEDDTLLDFMGLISKVVK